jgi:hypothetical protein
MKKNFRRNSVAGAVLALAIGLASARAAGLASGEYVLNVPYAAVCLNGTYPFTAGGVTTRSFVAMSIDGDGKVTGTLDMRSLKAGVTGNLGSQSNTIALHLHTSGQDASQVPSDITGTLQGSKFLGAGTTNKGTVPCTLDVSTAVPFTVTYDVTLSVNDKGQVSGSGSAMSCAEVIPVTVTGTSDAVSCSLHVAAPSLAQFTWDGSGSSTYTGFVADWSAHGFGLSRSGKGVVVEPKAAVPALLANISTRLATQTGDNVLIGGFIITGTQNKKVIIRALGPSLPVNGKLADPRLELHNAAGAIIASNDNWRDAANKQEIIDSTIAPTNDKESAVLTSLAPGAYTAIVSGVGNITGVALVEVYDLDTAADSRLANIATRGLVQTGDNVLIGGFIAVGKLPQRIIVRAIGASLTLTNKLVDPLLELHDPNGGLLAANNDWSTDYPEAIAATSLAPSDAKEAAIVATLLPGAYTAIVRGVNGATGVGVVEVYGLNP